jgi:hypothetical protein
MLSPLLPLPFYLCCLAAVVLGLRAWQGREEGWGIPMGVVVVTAAAWHIGDALYNNYEDYLQIQGSESLTNAWWEVLLFFISFGVLVPVMNRKINGDLEPRSQIFQMMRNLTIDTDWFQNQVSLIAKLVIVPWILLMTLALIKSEFNVVGMFFPYLGVKASPWARDRLGGGIDAIYALANYVQILLTALFGVVLALSKRKSTMTLAGFIYFLSAPFYIFDRTRNSMLAILLPGFMAFITLRIRGGIIIRLGVIVVAFIAMDGWMKFVIESRGEGVSITNAFQKKQSNDSEGIDEDAKKQKKTKHEGFNIFEELGYINYFIANGTYKVNWGERYFAEIVNPIPRVLWPGKPMIGIDYAIARGMAYGNQDASQGGVACSVSTGMIGQGVVNFGRILGPIAAALLMAIWVAVLARQDLMGNDIGHLLLYAIGLVLTFNMGRDITLLVIYPFVFGWLLLWWNNLRKQRAS